MWIRELDVRDGILAAGLTLTLAGSFGLDIWFGVFTLGVLILMFSGLGIVRDAKQKAQRGGR